MTRYSGPLLVRHTSDALLAARNSGTPTWTGSLDLGRNSDEVRLFTDDWEYRGARHPYPGKLKDRTIHWWDGEEFVAVVSAQNDQARACSSRAYALPNSLGYAQLPRILNRLN